MRATASQHQAWRSRADFKATVWAWARKLNVTPSRVQIQRMTRKWASCSSTGAISFSSELLEKERHFGEAVIVHELLHLTIRNHGKLFRSLLRAHLPGIDVEAMGVAACGVVVGQPMSEVTEGL